MPETKAVTAQLVIDPNLCGADRDCVDMCEQGVLEISPDRLEPVIAHFERCVDSCTLCIDICSKNALSKVPI